MFFDSSSQAAQNFHVPLVYNFAYGITKETKYTNSNYYMEVLKEICIECF